MKLLILAIVASWVFLVATVVGQERPEPETELEARFLNDPREMLNARPPETAPPSIEIVEHISESKVTVAKLVCIASPHISYQNPLFEQPQLERHGVSRTVLLRPAASCSQFFVDAIFLPIRVGIRQNKIHESSSVWGLPSPIVPSNEWYSGDYVPARGKRE